MIHILLKEGSGIRPGTVHGNPLARLGLAGIVFVVQLDVVTE
jgi:hypothetical protein